MHLAFLLLCRMLWQSSLLTHQMHSRFLCAVMFHSHALIPNMEVSPSSPFVSSSSSSRSSHLHHHTTLLSQMSTPPLLTTPEITRLHSYFLHTQLHAETQNLATTPPNPETTPLAHFLTKNVLHTFPFTRGKPEFWEKIWEFVAQVKKRRFSTSAERQEATLRKLWTEK